MTRDAIIDAIRTLLRDKLDNQHLDAFAPTARLNEDLYIDSILLLNLLLGLELDYGLSAPDDLVSTQELTTVADLAALYTPQDTAPASAEPAAASVHDELDYDLKIHCFVSCVCDGLKQAKIDHRPFYFGVWDADFAVSARWELQYHAPGLRHDFFRLWFRRLYGAEVAEWYDQGADKESNLATLLRLVAARRPEQAVMVMVDLYHLPERDNKFNQNPFPHYLMLEAAADPDVFAVRDPDFRWEGPIAREKIVTAFRQPSVAGGFLIDRTALRPATAADVAAFFEACFLRTRNPLTEAIRRILTAHLAGDPAFPPSALSVALREIPVLSIRKYAYEHGFAFFWRALKWSDASFLEHCDAIEALFQGYKALHFAVLRLSETADMALAPDLFARLDGLDTQEFALKRVLDGAFAAYRAAFLRQEVA